METEIEAKFLVPNRDIYQQLQKLQKLGEYTISDKETQTVTDTYLDTLNHQILKARYACRVRQSGTIYTLALKALTPSDGVIHRREELESVLPRALPPHQWPHSNVQHKIFSITNDAPLETLFSLQQKRQKYQVRFQGKIVAELSLDTVRQTHSGYTQVYIELEIELKANGTEDDLAALVTILQKTYTLQPQHISKFERGLNFVKITALQAHQKTPAKLTASPIPGLTPHDTMTEAAQKILQYHFQRLLDHENGTLVGVDSKELHKMRVATRRMRSAIQIVARYLHKNKIKPHLKHIRHIARVLGQVRDMDVFYEKTVAYINSRPAEEQENFDTLMRAWKRAYAKTRNTLQAYLKSSEYANFKQEYAIYLAHPAEIVARPFRNDSVIPHHVKYVAPIVIYQCLANVRAYDIQLSATDIPLKHYHQLRIAAKHLRYTLEFFEEVLNPEAQAAIDEVKILQDHLGDLQDAIITAERLHNFQTWGSWDRPTATTEAKVQPQASVTTYQTAKQTEIRQLLSTFPKVWEQFQNSSFGRHIAHALKDL